MHWLPEQLIPQMLPRWHYKHIHNDVLPALRAAGVSEGDIRAMLVDNPREIFERHGEY
jgi:phosphotriesterase-related protein